MTAIHWLSFCDPDRPKGTQFLGAAIVEGENFLVAVMNAHALGCNPGGEVQGHTVAACVAPLIRAHWIGRLLTREECAALDDEVMRERRLRGVTDDMIAAESESS